MGITKRYYEWATENGRNLAAIEDKAICEQCLDEPGLSDLIRELSSGDVSCSYCTAQSAAPLALVVEAIDETLAAYYDDPAEWLPYESAEGGFQGAVYETADVVYDLLPELEKLVVDDIVEGLGYDRSWCDFDPFGPRPLEHMKGGWRKFCTTIKRQRRFFALSPQYDRDSDLPRESMVAEHLLQMLRSLLVEEGLLIDLEEGTPLYRVRLQNDDTLYSSAHEFSAPPATVIRSNRLSPPGVRMLYTAQEPDTALLEAQTGAGHYREATFHAARPLRLVDFTDLPPVPAIFENRGGRDPHDQRWRRESLLFLHDFVADAIQPIANDDRVHVDYLPTQVAAEYLKLELSAEEGGLDGIRLPSAKVPGGRNVVLFDPRGAVREADEEEWLIGCRGEPALVFINVRSRTYP